MSPPIGIVGAGSFGRALATAATRVERRVILWSREDRAPANPGIVITRDWADLQAAELIFLAVPSPHVQPIAEELGHVVDGSHLLVHVSRGLVGDELETLTHLLARTTPAKRLGVLAGPMVAESLLEGHPGGGIVGSWFPEVGQAVQDAIGGPTLRIYTTEDVLGVEIASAYVGLLCLALGFALEKGFGPGTLAVLSTRGIAEANRLGAHLGAQERTFAGLAGFGDLLAALAGDGRPEIQLGQALARGESPTDAAAHIPSFVEAISFSRQVSLFAQRYGIATPIADGLAQLLEGKSSSRVIQELMTRPAKSE